MNIEPESRHLLDAATFVAALSSRRLEAHCGLYAVAAEEKWTQFVQHGVMARPIGTQNPSRIGGIQIGKHGLKFDFIFDRSAIGANQTRATFPTRNLGNGARNQDPGK
jgi:hypothetical protein